MKILTLSRLGGLIQLAAILVASGVMIYTSERVDQELLRERVANEIHDASDSLRYLTMEFLLSQGERTRQQWWRRHDSLSRLLDSAAALGCTATLDDLRRDNRSFGLMFSEIESNLAEGRTPLDEKDMAEQRSRLIGQVMTRVESIANVSDGMAAQSRMRAVETRRHAYMVMAPLVILMLALVLLTQLLLQRRLIRPLLRLREGTATVGSGNLGFRVGLDGSDDEIGQLARAFDAMTVSLESTTVSRAELVQANLALQGEVQERLAAEHKVGAQLAGLKLLHQITRAIADRQDVDSIFQVVVRSLEELLPVDYACICMHGADNEILVAKCVRSPSDALDREIATIDQAPVALNGIGFPRRDDHELVYKPELGAGASPFEQRLAAAGLRSLVAAPLVVESRVYGVLFVARRQQEAFSSAECEFLQQLSEHVALASHEVEIHQALREAYEHLRKTQRAVMQHERLRALGQMASGIAHDINNAISPVALYAELLLAREPGLSERGREQLSVIQRSIEDVAQTVARMREFYREAPSELVAVALNDLVTQVVKLTKAQWSDVPQRRGVVIGVSTDLEPELPLIKGVASELREALTNLVFNATDALPEGGTITLRTRLQAAAPGGGGTPAHVTVEVTDSGIGMDEATRGRCMEPFFTTKGERGTGLGLAMVYGTAQRHGAAVEIDSAPRHGTTVRIRFPVPGRETIQAAETAPAPLELPGLRILSIDDDPVLLASLSSTLEADGHQVTVADGGRAGIDAFHGTLGKGMSFDVVITDLGMPNVSGREVAAAIKQMSPNTPVLLLTGWGQRLVAKGDFPAHVDGVLAKPPRMRDIRKELARVCASGRL